MSDIRILINASLNKGLSINEINKSIKEIQKSDSLQKIKLKIDIDQKFTQSINQFISAIGKMNLKELDGSMKTITKSSASFRSEASRVQNEINKIGASAKTAASHSISFGSALSTAFQKFPIWMVATTAFYAPLRALESGIKTIYDLDTAMTDLRKVTNETTQTYTQFQREAASIASSIGGLTLDVIKSSTEWARLGYNIQQAQQLAKQTLIYQNVGDIKSAEDASMSLISTIKGFGIEVDAQGKNVQKIVDIYNEVGNKFAISSAGIGEAIRRSASSLSEAGNTIEESVALATGANSTIQDPARVGQALKTISMRLRGVSDEGEDLSELVPSLEKKFNSIGLTLKKDDNTFKNTYEVFKDLSTVWDDLGDMPKAEILELVAGKLQGNIAASLIQNFSDSEKALSTALDSVGSAAAENEKFLDSMKGKLSILSNEVSTFWQKSMDSSFLKGVISLATNLVTAFDNLGNVVSLATGIFLTFKSKAIAAFITGTYSSIKGLLTFNATMRSTALSAEATTVAVQGTSVAMTGLQRALGVFGLVLTAGSLIYTVFNDLNGATEQSIDLINESNAKYSDHADELKETLSYYKENYEAISSDANVKDKLFEIQNKLIETFGKEAEGLDLVNGKYDDQLKKLDEIKQKNLENQIADNQIIADAISDKQYSRPVLSNKVTMQGDLGMGNQEYNVGGDIGLGDLDVVEYYKQLNELYEGIHKYSEDVFASQKLIPANTEEWSNALASVKDKMDAIKPLVDQINALEDLKKEKIKNSTISQAHFNEVQREMFDNVNNVFKTQSTDEYAKSIANVTTIIKSVDTKNLTDAINKIKELPTVKLNGDLVSQLDELLFNISKNADATNKASEAQKELSQHFDDTISSLSSLSSAYDTLSQGEQLSADNLIELIDNYPELASYLAQTNDLTFDKGEIIKKVAELDRQARIEEFQRSLDAVEVTRNELTAKQELYKEFFQKLLDASPNSSQIPFMLQIGREEQAKLDEANLQADNLKAKITALSQPLSFYNPSRKKDKTDKNKDEAKLQDATEARINAINAEAVAQHKLNEQLSASISSDSDLATQMKQTTALIASQTKESKLLEGANTKLLSKRDALQSSNSKYNMSSWIDANGEATESFIKLFNSMGSGSSQEALQSLYDQYSQYTMAIRENKLSIIELAKENKKLGFDNALRSIEKMSQGYAKFQDDITASENKQIRQEENSAGFVAETKNQIDIRKKWQLQLHKDNEALRKQQKGLATTDPLFMKLSDAIKENSNSWWGLEEAVLASTKSIEDAQKTLANEAIEAQKQLDQFNLDQQEKQLNAYKKTQQDKIDGIQDEIDALQEKWDLEEEIAERNEYINEISRLNQVAAILQNGTLSSISDELAKQLKIEDLKKQEIEHQNALLEKQKELQTVQQEKNVRLFENGQFNWVADPRKIKELQEEVANMEKDYSEERKNNLDSTLDELKNQEEAYQEWKDQKQKDAIIASKEQQKKAIEDEIATREESFALEQEAFTTHYEYMDILAAQYLDQLKDTYGEKWDEILTVLQGKITSAEAMYNTLRGYSGSSMGGTTSLLSQMQSNSSAWHSASSADKAKLAKANQDISKKLAASGVKTTYDPKTGKWDILEYHTGMQEGIVGSDKPIASWLSKFGLKNNEKIAKLLNGEMIIKDPINMVQNFVTGMNGVGSILNSLKKPSVAGVPNEIYNFSNITVQTNDASQFLQNLKNIAKNK